MASDIRARDCRHRHGPCFRYRGAFAWIDSELPDGEIVPLIRLRYLGSADDWGFGLYLASSDKYEDQILPTGGFTGTPEGFPGATA